MTPMVRRRVRAVVNSQSDSLISALDASIETFAQRRTADPLCAAAADTLEEARAMIARALEGERRGGIVNRATVSTWRGRG